MIDKTCPYEDITEKVVFRSRWIGSSRSASGSVISGSGVWRKHVVATSGSHNIVLFDVDGDGRIDIFGANWNNSSSTRGAIELRLNHPA